jgi:hypothetical protein
VYRCIMYPCETLSVSCEALTSSQFRFQKSVHHRSWSSRAAPAFRRPCSGARITASAMPPGKLFAWSSAPAIASRGSSKDRWLFGLLLTGLAEVSTKFVN